MMAVDGRDGCGRPRTTVAAVDGNEQLLTAVDGSDGCGRMPTAVDRRGRPSMAMMLADSPGLRWRDAQGRGQVQEWRRSGHGRVLHTSSVWCYHQHATHETFLVEGGRGRKSIPWSAESSTNNLLNARPVEGVTVLSPICD